MRFTLAALVFSALVFGGCAREKPIPTKSPSTVSVNARVAAIQNGFSTELAIMAKYRADPRSFDVMDSERLLAKARWFFSEADLVGLQRPDVEALLGNSTRQIYGNGHISVIREIVYDSSNKVAYVKAWRSE